MIGNPMLAVDKLYDILPASAGGSLEGRTPADNPTVRSVFVIGTDKKVKLTLTYPMSPGCDFDEILRALDSIQLTAKYQVAIPVQWKQDKDVIVIMHKLIPRRRPVHRQRHQREHDRHHPHRNARQRSCSRSNRNRGGI